MLKWACGKVGIDMSTNHDWKLFTERLPLWQERYMGKLVEDYINILSNKTKEASDKFWALDQIIKEDKKSPGVRLEIRKSDMEIDIMRLLKDGAITLEDLEGFSEELIERAKSCLK